MSISALSAGHAPLFACCLHFRASNYARHLQLSSIVFRACLTAATLFPFQFYTGEYNERNSSAPGLGWKSLLPDTCNASFMSSFFKMAPKQSKSGRKFPAKWRQRKNHTNGFTLTVQWIYLKNFLKTRVKIIILVRQQP